MSDISDNQIDIEDELDIIPKSNIKSNMMPKLRKCKYQFNKI